MLKISRSAGLVVVAMVTASTPIFTPPVWCRHPKPFNLTCSDPKSGMIRARMCCHNVHVVLLDAHTQQWWGVCVR